MITKKRKKSSRFRGWQHAKRGGNERTRGHGNIGGHGMAGTGKRADQKKTLVVGPGLKYFGKSKTLRRGQAIKKLETISLGRIQDNIKSLLATGVAKLTKDTYEIGLEDNKVLLTEPFTLKAKITAAAATKGAIAKVESLGGSLFVEEKKVKAPVKKPTEKPDKKEAKPKAKAKKSA
jgi:large subunit ribosomal protein L15